jgi:hypothetical protein
LWPLANEGVAHRFFEEIEELELKLVDRLRGGMYLAWDHPIPHALPLVAGGGMKNNPIQPDLVLLTTIYGLERS